MRGEHVNIEVANTMLGPSSYFHVRVFSLSFHTSMMTYVSDIASELLPCKSSRGGSVHFLVRRPSFTFSPEIGRKRLPCKPAGFSILTSTVKGRGVLVAPADHFKRFHQQKRVYPGPDVFLGGAIQGLAQLAAYT